MINFTSTQKPIYNFKTRGIITLILKFLNHLPGSSFCSSIQNHYKKDKLLDYNTNQ